jgi:diguanylate cyclase (GGDEF)-like protein
MLGHGHFKQINDRFGHAKGDKLLAAVGTALRSCLRASDVAGALRREELLVLLPETTAQDAVALSERIRDTIARKGARRRPCDHRQHRRRRPAGRRRRARWYWSAVR